MYVYIYIYTEIASSGPSAADRGGAAPVPATTRAN